MIGKVVMTTDFEKAFDAAVRILKNRPHSFYELKRKLRSRGYEAQVTEDVLQQCARYNYLNDAEFARIYADELKSRGRGMRWIRRKLMEKGIAAEVIELLCQENDSDAEAARAAQVFKRKLHSLVRESDLRKKRAALYRFMISRGFSPQIVLELLQDQEL